MFPKKRSWKALLVCKHTKTISKLAMAHASGFLLSHSLPLVKRPT